MKKFLIATAAIAASLGAMTATASAQPINRGAPAYSQNINAQQAEISRRIDVGQRTGQLTFREAARLRVELREIARLEARYRYNGLNRFERNDLDRRLDRLAVQVRFERRDMDNRYDGRWRS